MSRSQKQVYSASQDTMREEVNLLIGKGQRQEAIRQYQEKCACSIDSAVNFVNQVSAERIRQQRDQMNRTRELYLA